MEWKTNIKHFYYQNYMTGTYAFIRFYFVFAGDFLQPEIVEVIEFTL